MCVLQFLREALQFIEQRTFYFTNNRLHEFCKGERDKVWLRMEAGTHLGRGNEALYRGVTMSNSGVVCRHSTRVS